jgi:F-type H+-transporting ATPase subunit b
MRKSTLIKRLLVLIMLLSMVFAALPAMAADEAAQDGEDTHAEEVAHEEEAGGSPLDPLGINTGLLAVQMLNFLILLGILTPMLWRPAVNMLDARSEKIKKGIEDAAAAAKARENAEVEAEKILAQARTEAQKVIDEARGRGDDVAKGIEQEARQAAEKIQADAQADALAQRDAQLGDLREQVLNISTAVAGRILGENLDAGKQKALVDGFIADLPEGAKGLGGSVEVISAMPLSDAEQNSVKSAIGADAATFSVDPAILGGLIVRSADRVVDGSVRSNLGKLTGSLS